MKFFLSTHTNNPQRGQKGHRPSPAVWNTPAEGSAERRPALVPAVEPLRVPPGVGLRHRVGALCLFLVASFISYYLVSHFVVTAVIVQGKSMSPTLEDGEQYLLNRLSYCRRPPQRGDLVVLRDPGHTDCAVKRVIAMAGDSLHLKGGQVYLNGKCLREPYLRPGTKTYPADTNEQFIVIGKDQYFVLGDNRSNSEDSRYYGTVLREWIIGSIAK